MNNQVLEQKDILIQKLPSDHLNRFSVQFVGLYQEFEKEAKKELCLADYSADIAKEKAVLEIVNERNEIFVIQTAAAAIGFVIVIRSESGTYIKSIYVDPEWRKRGVAKNALNTLLYYSNAPYLFNYFTQMDQAAWFWMKFSSQGYMKGFKVVVYEDEFQYAHCQILI